MTPPRCDDCGRCTPVLMATAAGRFCRLCYFPEPTKEKK